MSAPIPRQDACTFTLENGERCGRAPVTADYQEWDPITGARLIACLCARHDGRAAQAFALAHDYERQPRDAERPLRLVDGRAP